MKYTIYCIKNKINNKVYVGYTSKTIEKRFVKHIKNAENKVNRRLYDSMNHHGYNNFEITKIDECNTKLKAEELESWYIYLFKSKDPISGYNMTWGGDGGYTLSNWPEDDKQILYQKQQKNREKTLLKKYGVNTPSKINWVRNKISNSHNGKSLTQSHKDSIGKTIKNKIISGELIQNTSGLRPHIKGEFTHTNESKKKISDFRNGKTYEEIYGLDVAEKLKRERSENFKGKNNPNYIPELMNHEKKFIILQFINNKKMKEVSLSTKLSEYKIRQFLRESGIENIQRLKQLDKNNFKLNNILKSYE